MKKLISLLLVLFLIPAVSAERSVDKSEPITDFQVYKWVSSYAANTVSVLTVESGERGYVVISSTTEEGYVRGLKIAKSLIGTEPDQVRGTRFAYVTAEI